MTGINLTQGPLLPKMMAFAIPYLLACFLQTFYGMADLFITGLFNGAAPITAVSIGSQLMHMLTVIIVGLAMGTTVSISRAVGGGDRKEASCCIGSSVLLFALFSLVSTVLLLLSIDPILSWLKTPAEAWEDTRAYLLICFAGIPFIVAYNVLASIFRGLGDTRTPMYFIALAGLINLLLDYIFIGPMAMGAAGAAAATILSEAVSVLLCLWYLTRADLGLAFTKKSFSFDALRMKTLLAIGLPISCQDGLIQISFLIITAIANSRGVEVAAAVGIVEKIISFLFLVPSAMLSTVAAFAAQNAGAGNDERGRQALLCGIRVCIIFGLFTTLVVHFCAEWVISLFVSHEPEVVRLGGEYFRTYVIDCIFAGIHFCFSGYFSAYGKSIYSFLHNMISIVTVRVPGTYLAILLFPETLSPMGLAAPMGSLLSAIICMELYHWKFKRSADQRSD